jgi:outer membrane protein assembly factor BamB
MPIALCRRVLVRAIVLITFVAAMLPSLVRADFTFVHTTDMHFTADRKAGSPADRDAAMFREISNLQPRPAFIASTGDVCESGTPAEYAVYQDVAKANLTLPHHDAPGNHDIRWNPLGKEGFTRGVGQPLYQSWDYENVHFVLLDATVTLQHWGHFDRAMLEWLAADLKKVGPDRPVIIGMHHWIGRGAAASSKVDNEGELLDVTAPYNVRLWIIGHGHADIQWDIEGVPAIMAKGLYQGSYHLIKVTKTEIRVRRRSNEVAPKELVKDAKDKSAPKAPTAEWVDLMTIPLKKQHAPKWQAKAEVKGDKLLVNATGELVRQAKLECRVGNGKPVAMTSGRAEIDVSELSDGEHIVTVEAALPDSRTFHRRTSVTIKRPGGISPAWAVDVGGAVQGHLACDGKTVYVPTLAGELVAVDSATGKIRWRFKTNGPVHSTPHVDAGTVYFGSADHYVYAVNTADGSQRWKHATDGAVLAGAATARGVVCIGSADTNIYGLKIADGSLAWTVKGGSLFQSKAATDGRTFFVCGWDNQFRGIDAVTGEVRWHHKFGRSFYYAPAICSPALNATDVFVSSNDGVLHAVQIADGKIHWERDGLKCGYSSPVLSKTRLFIASLEGRLHCLDFSTGNRDWDKPSAGTTYDSSPILVGDTLLLTSVTGTVFAARAADGEPQWRYSVGSGHFLSTPATDGQRVVLSSLAGKLVAIDAQKMSNTPKMPHTN